MKKSLRDKFSACKPSTLEAHDADLELLSKFLTEVGKMADNDFSHDEKVWEGISYGLVVGFVTWLRKKGAMATTIDRRLTTIRQYARESGCVADNEMALIETIHVFPPNASGPRRGRRKRKKQPIRFVEITPEQAMRLKEHNSSPVGRHDSLLMHLLLENGLRASEIANLTVESLRDDHPFTMAPKTFTAWQVYQRHCPSGGPILLRGFINGTLGYTALTESGIKARVKKLGQEIGLPNLSIRDCRRHWALHGTWGGVDLVELQEAGGWEDIPAVLDHIKTDSKISMKLTRLNA